MSSSTFTAPELLAKAAGHMADRAAIYDKPDGERSMGRAVQAFNAITGGALTEAKAGERVVTILDNDQ